MYSFGKKSLIIVLVLFILIAIFGWAWRQRDSMPFISRPLQMIVSPFEYAASGILDTLSSNFHIVDVSLKNRIEWESLEKENAALKEKSVDYDEIAAENKRYREMLDFKAAHRQFNVRAA